MSLSPGTRQSIIARSALVVALIGLAAGPAWVQADGELPRRPTQRPLMTTSVPHMQVDVTPRVSVHDLLFRSVFALPEVENYPANVIGARTIRLPDRLVRRQQRSGRGGRGGGPGGVGHIHGDGSLHVNLPEDRIRDIVNARWGARHPTLENYMMLFTPQSTAELAVTFQLIVEAYNYTTGRNVLAEDYLAPPETRLRDPPIKTVFVVEGEPRYHDERRCLYFQGRDVHEATIYDLGPAANPHICVLPPGANR